MNNRFHPEAPYRLCRLKRFPYGILYEPRATGSGVVFGQRSTTWEAGDPKTTPDPFRTIPPRNTWPSARSDRPTCLTTDGQNDYGAQEAGDGQQSEDGCGAVKVDNPSDQRVCHCCDEIGPHVHHPDGRGGTAPAQ